MTLLAVGVWLVGFVTLVPLAAYRLLFVAGRDEYALLITGILFWIFGYWGVVGPLLATLKLRRLFRAFEAASSREERMLLLTSPEAQEAAVDAAAADSGLPKFLVRFVWRRLSPALRRALEKEPAVTP